MTRPSDPSSKAVRLGQIDWRTIRDTINLAEVAERLLGPPPGRRGERGHKLWWRCPLGTHEDGNPSFCITPGNARWKCWGCGESGDVATLTMKIKGMTFREAVRHLAGTPAPTRPRAPSQRPAEQPPAVSNGMTPEAAEALVEEAEQCLWRPSGFGPSALGYLHRRGLTDETIRKARLGYVVSLDMPGHPQGILIPWFDGDRLALLTIRQRDGRKPKYREIWRDGPTLYPGRHVIRPGRPLVIVEGELDALLLGQELADLSVAVVTLGSASARPVPDIFAAMLIAAPWYVATDNDPAGDKAADGWPARARRVRPPCKDWTVCHVAGIDLRRWWQKAMVQEKLLARIQARGIRLDGQVVHPQIAIGTVTGRAVYTNPALQILPASDRMARLTPVVEGRVFVRADYGQIEPRIMLAILRRHNLIAWDAGDDLYRDLIADDSVDRDTVKVIVNKIVNGGSAEPGATGRLAEFINAADTYRVGLAAEVRTRRCVMTLAGRSIGLATDETNYAGKAVNRVVQGTAADIFNRAAATIDEALGERGAVAFLLYDEVWVECDPADVPAVAGMIRAEMMTAALELGVYVPIRMDPEPEQTTPFSWDQLSRWRWGSAVGDSTLGIIIDRPDPGRMPEALKAAAQSNAVELAEEREAIREFGGG